MSKFTDFFSNLGHGISSIGKPIMGALGSLAPMAGTAIGGMFGGPAGMMLGNSLGGMAGNLFGQLGGGGGQAPQAPQMQTGGGLQSQMPVGGGNEAMMSQFSPMQKYGQQYGRRAGGYLDQMLPEQLQGMEMGPLATAGGGYLGGHLNKMLPSFMQPMGLGQRLGGYLGNQMASRLPAGYENKTLGGAGSMMGGRFGGRMNNQISPYMQRFGIGGAQPTAVPQALAHGGQVGHFHHYGHPGHYGHHQGGFHNLRDMGDVLGHHFDDGGLVY